jgi:hypothetical protein
LERPFPFGVILDVLKFDSGDSQGGRKLIGGQYERKRISATNEHE